MNFLNKLLFISIFSLVTNSLLSQNPNWVAPNAVDFDFNSSVVATIALDGVISNNQEDRIAYFVDGEIRGLSTPVDIGGSIYRHFITLYLNEGIEEMDVQLYHEDSDEVYSVAFGLEIEVQTIYGTVDDPYQIEVDEEDYVPVTILPVPDQQSIAGLILEDIDMSAYLIQLNASGVEWTFSNNNNLIVGLYEGILSVEGEIDFSGMTTLTVIATELESPYHFAQLTINYNITPWYSDPLWSTIPSQGIVVGDEFELLCLDDYEESYGGEHLEYDYTPQIEESANPDDIPNWFYSDNLATNMTLTTMVNYTPKYQYNHPDDILAAFIDDEIRGVVTQNEESGLYFLTIAGDADEAGDVTLKFYSGAQKTIVVKNNVFAYEPHKIEGTVDVPDTTDLAPMVPILTNNSSTGYNSKMQMEIIDDAYLGTQTFDFYAFDSIYPFYLRDTTTASFCIVDNVTELVTLYLDMDGDGLGDASTAVQACFEMEGYVTNGDDCDDTTASDETAIITVAEDSGFMENDGFVCSGSTVVLSVSEGSSFVWSTGETTQSISVSPTTDSIFTVSTTLDSGCISMGSTTIQVESKIVNNVLNDGHGTLRNILSCALDGDTITYDQPTTLQSELSTSIVIDKNIVLKGLNLNNRPTISIDFDQVVFGFEIENDKTLTLQNIDLHLEKPAGKSTVTGEGSLIITKVTVVTEE